MAVGVLSQGRRCDSEFLGNHVIPDALGKEHLPQVPVNILRFGHGINYTSSKPVTMVGLGFATITLRVLPGFHFTVARPLVDIGPTYQTKRVSPRRLSDAP